MTTKAILRDLVATILDGATIAEDQVYTPADWPTWDRQYPVILVRAPREEKESLGRGTVSFNVVATIEIVAKVELFADVADLGAAMTEEALEALGEQIVRLVINNPQITELTQQIVFVHTDQGFSSEGEKDLGELKLQLGLEYYQGPEDFFEVEGVPLTEVQVHADLTNRFDAAATYPDPPFPGAVIPAPRTAGPDGRDEGALDIILPQ